MKHKEDVLDIVFIQISNRIKSKEEAHIDVKEIISNVQEAITQTRQMCAGDNYIRHDKPEIREAYTLWMQQKQTDKTMREIYNYIADRLGSISPRTVEGYVTQFIKGFNPYEIQEA